MHGPLIGNAAPRISDIIISSALSGRLSAEPKELVDGYITEIMVQFEDDQATLSRARIQRRVGYLC